MENIEEPAILPDLTVYEYGAIKRWFKKYNTDPLTNLPLKRYHQNVELSNKIIYLPKMGKFKHFEFV